ncbi:MAG: ChaN family lipoprotein, partial [Deltaproteobacteria bacterium]|nr:ChaN family lipoprotein [Deltaproteobacteria bacterium]
CGMLPATMLGPMALAQRARDGEMAAAMVASGERGSLLVAGSGHVRRDRGVPWVLAALHSVGARDARAIANVEVERGVHDPRSYARGFGAEVLPFDYVVFTAKANDDDPCAAMRSPAPAPSASVRRAR